MLDSEIEYRISRQKWLETRRLAYELWEAAGHPDGTALRDWYLAETILREVEAVIAGR